MSQHSEPFKPDPNAKSIPMAFIVDASTQIPMLVLALQKAGLAYILAVGDSPALWVPVATQSFGSLEITYKSGEVVFQDGTVGSGPDLAIDANPRIGPDSPAVQAALALLESKKAPGSTIHWRSAAALPLREADKPYKEMLNPDLAWRQFAVIRLWAVIDGFFPYKDLMEKPWSEALPEFLTQMELVKDGEGYAKALARMSALLQDNHVKILGHPILDQLRGEAGLPFGLRMVERSVLVDEIADVPAAHDLKRWDEVLEIDGESVGEYFSRMAPFVAAANPWTMDRNLVLRAGRGKDQTLAKLKIRRADGEVRDVSITRSKKFPIAYPETLHKGELIQVLSDGIGYVDLGRLMPSQVEDLFTKVKDTKALILDMRGYPNGTAWPISPYLNSRKATYGASFYPTTISGSAGEAEIGTVNFMQNLPINHGEPIYQGKVVMLINEMTISQAEHSGLFYEAACDITFIGSPTAGSNGDVTDLMLPGGIRMTFTGQGVKHADGRQLQRVGLQPKVFVRPTVKGVREGRDEVMDRAIRYIQEGQ
jgi:C-terminal processing protease CtpA/Prc